MRKFFRSVLFTLVLLSLCALNAFLIYLYFFGSKEQDLSGEWTADLDMSEQAAVTAYIWLQDIEGVSVSPEEVESRIPELTVEVNMKLEQTGQAEGTFQCMINQDSYDACDQAAYEAFAAAFNLQPRGSAWRGMRAARRRKPWRRLRLRPSVCPPFPI